MALLNIFDPATTSTLLARLDKISPDTKPQWGKMNAAQMFAHLNIGYDMSYGKIETKNNFFVKLMLKLFVKNGVVGEKPYPKNSRTSPVFIITDEREFNAEKARLKQYIIETEKHGAVYFEGRESPSFGPLSAKEWSNQYYKHIDHHFTQFGV